jgi:hypothetical protein
MTTSLKALCGITALSVAVLADPLTAQAQCEDCNRPVSSTKVNTSYKTNTVRRTQNVTRYKDVNKTRHVTHTKRVVTVNQIQPVTRVNVVTRVHNRTKILRENQNVAQSKTLPTQTINSGSTQHLSEGPSGAQSRPIRSIATKR